MACTAIAHCVPSLPSQHPNCTHSLLAAALHMMVHLSLTTWWEAKADQDAPTRKQAQWMAGIAITHGRTQGTVDHIWSVPLSVVPRRLADPACPCPGTHLRSMTEGMAAGSVGMPMSAPVKLGDSSELQSTEKTRPCRWCMVMTHAHATKRVSPH